MSRVTTAVILVSEWGDVTEEMILNHEFSEHQVFLKADSEKSGGYKHLECDLYAAGFNYVDGKELRKWFHNLPWGSYGAAYLVWETNGERRGFASVNWINDVSLA